MQRLALMGCGTQTTLPEAIKKIAFLCQQMVLRQIDKQFDHLFATLRQFRRFRLYVHPSEVSLEELNLVEEAFLAVADQNRDGGDMTLCKAVLFYTTLQRARWQYARAIDHMEQALNWYALMRHVCLLDR